MRHWSQPIRAWLLTGALLWASMQLGRGVLYAETTDTQVTLYQSLLATRSSPSINLFRGSAGCSGCHSGQGSFQSDVFNRVTLTEYPIWEKSDLHRSANAALSSERGKSISRYVSKDAAIRCIQCHSLAAELPAKLYDEPKRQELVENGVNCEMCHGPAKNWFELHSEHRDNQYPKMHNTSGTAKAAVGFIDVRNPVTRAELCISCHQSSSAHGRVITHEMYAAGHPPLTGFELETFADKAPRHWRYAREKTNVAAIPFERTRNSLVAAVVSMRMSLELAVADATAKPGKWPELARLDCFACHHDLQSRGVRPVHGGFAGRPPIMVGCVPLVRAAAAIADKSSIDRLNGIMKGLESSFATNPFGDPGELERQGNALTIWCVSIENELAAMPFAPQQARNALRQIAHQAVAEERDYDTSRQLIDAFIICYRDLLAEKDSGLSAEQRKQITSLITGNNAKWREFAEATSFVPGRDAKLPKRKEFDDVLKGHFTSRTQHDPAAFREFMLSLGSNVPK